jgi:hypothetical protein
MSLHLYQIVVLALAAFMIYQGGTKFLKHEDGQTFLKFLVRIVIWGGMAGIAAFPNLSTQVAAIIGIEGNINAVVLIGFILIFLLIFKLLSAIERLEQQITSFTRKDSLTGFQKQERE